MKESDTRAVYCLPPCPAWDVEGTESWLADQAARGLCLSPDGFWGGVAVFERCAPQAVRYRLEAVRRPGPVGDEVPDGEAVALSEALGWRYVARRGEFFIYTTSDPGARELNTDPAVQALALKAVTRRRREMVVISFFWLMIYPLLRLGGHWTITAIQIGSGFFLWGELLLLWIFAGIVAQAIHLSRLRRRLVRGKPSITARIGSAARCAISRSGC